MAAWANALDRHSAVSRRAIGPILLEDALVHLAGHQGRLPSLQSGRHSTHHIGPALLLDRCGSADGESVPVLDLSAREAANLFHHKRHNKADLVLSPNSHVVPNQRKRFYRQLVIALHLSRAGPYDFCFDSKSESSLLKAHHYASCGTQSLVEQTKPNK